MTLEMVQRRIKVCVVSTHSIVLQEIQRVLTGDAFEVAPARVTAQGFEGAQIPGAAVYVIDSEGTSESLIGLIQQIVERAPDARMVVLGESFSETSAFPLLSLGVKGLVAHELLEQQLPRALEAVCGGGYWVPRTLLASFVDSVISNTRQTTPGKPTGVAVSRREKEIVDALLMNLSNKEIATRLNISERTVKFHVSNLLSKFHVQRRADLILLWFQQGRRPEEKSADGARRIQ
jgi:DNA-binding NarL/FixJ family response regulator